MCLFVTDVDDAFTAWSTTASKTEATASSDCGPLTSDQTVGRSATYAWGAIGRGSAPPWAWPRRSCTTYALTRSIRRAWAADADVDVDVPTAAAARRVRAARGPPLGADGLAAVSRWDAKARKDESSQKMRLRSWKACSALMSRLAFGGMVIVKGK